MASSRLRQLLGGSLLVAIGLAVAQVLAYLLNLIAARLLGPESFGAYAALMSVMLIASTLALGLQATASRHIVAAPPLDRANVGQSLLRFGATTGFALGVFALLVSPLIATALRLGSWLPALIVAVIIGAFTLTGSQLGITQGHEAFGRLGLMYGSVQLCRTAGAVFGAVAGHTLTGTLLGLLVGTIAGVAVGQLIVAPLISNPKVALEGMRNDTWHATHALLALFVLTNMDILMARYFLPADESGLYAVGVLIAKVAFFLPQFIIVIAFPAMARQQDRRSIVTAALATAAIGVVVTLFVRFESEFVVSALGGSQYQELKGEAWLFAAEGALFAVAQVLLYGQLARANRAAVYFLWIAVALFATVVVVAAHDSVMAIVSTALIVAGLVVVAGTLRTLTAADSNPPLTMSEIGEFLEQ